MRLQESDSGPLHHEKPSYPSWRETWRSFVRQPKLNLLGGGLICAGVSLLGGQLVLQCGSAISNKMNLDKTCEVIGGIEDTRSLMRERVSIALHDLRFESSHGANLSFSRATLSDTQQIVNSCNRRLGENSVTPRGVTLFMNAYDEQMGRVPGR